MIDLSIVIVSWNSRAALGCCLDSVGAHTRGMRFEVIVVDNASTDGTAAHLRASYPNVRLVENGVNQGFARACNQGMALARGGQLLLLNPDTYVVDNVLGRAAELLRSRPHVGMLGVRLEYPDGRLQHTANRALTIRRTLFEKLGLYRLVPRSRRDLVLLDGYWEHDAEVEVDWLAGAFLLLRRSLFEESGGFDERFFMYGEDSEWCMRLRRTGHRILFTPAPGTVYHAGSVSSDLVWTDRERLRRCYAGGVESYAALNGRFLGLCFRAAELCGAAVRFAVYFAAGHARRDEYFTRQAAFYRWLAGVYAPGRLD